MDCSTPIRRAVIDVGTNSVKLLVAEVTGDSVVPIEEKSEQTRLGRGFYENHILQPAAIDDTADAVTRFAYKAKRLGAAPPRVIATSAARDAVNAADLVQAIYRASGLRLEIISGEQEAQWVFQGVITNPEFARSPLLIFDIGGGSTEFIFGEGKQQHCCFSFDLGSVRLMESIPHSDPPKPSELAACRSHAQEFVGKRIRPKLCPVIEGTGAKHVQLVATGGTATILARIQYALSSFERERIEAAALRLDQVQARIERLWSLPLAERRQLVGLPKKRADVILTGGAIFEAVLQQLNFSEVRVSTRGLRFAAVMTQGAGCA